MVTILIKGICIVESIISINYHYFMHNTNKKDNPMRDYLFITYYFLPSKKYVASISAVLSANAIG